LLKRRQPGAVLSATKSPTTRDPASARATAATTGKPATILASALEPTVTYKSTALPENGDCAGKTKEAPGGTWRPSAASAALSALMRVSICCVRQENTCFSACA